jgi:hypothetical protein
MFAIYDIMIMIRQPNKVTSPRRNLRNQVDRQGSYRRRRIYRLLRLCIRQLIPTDTSQLSFSRRLYMRL